MCEENLFHIMDSVHQMKPKSQSRELKDSFDVTIIQEVTAKSPAGIISRRGNDEERKLPIPVLKIAARRLTTGISKPDMIYNSSKHKPRDRIPFE
jgi:hypothetical protein